MSGYVVHEVQGMFIARHRWEKLWLIQSKLTGIMLEKAINCALAMWLYATLSNRPVMAIPKHACMLWHQ